MWRKALAVVLAAAMLGVEVPAQGAEPTNAPGGMHRFVVAIGRVDAGVRTNWNRLATYSFTQTNEVTESHWHWTQRERVSRSYTGVTAANCGARNCNVQTGNGFQSASAPDRLHGSNAEWATRATMAQIAAADHDSFVHTYYLWKTNAGTPYVDHGTGAPFWYRSFAVCTGGKCAAGRTDKAQYYIALPNPTATGRRDTLWHWFTANADGRGEYCYTGNSHVKPMMQIIDEDGRFHGWVGVEASINQTSPTQGTSADDIGVFVIADV